MTGKADVRPPRHAGTDDTAFIRITGTRRDRYVEFEFSLNDDTLSVELILPFAAFAEFRAARRASLLPPAPETAAAIRRLAWRLRQPELLAMLGNIPGNDGKIPNQAAP